MKDLKPYHYAWLSTHPKRDENWLRSMLSQGFHIHHIDGNHDNNEAKNLVLIEEADHLFLHGMDRLKFVRAKRAPKVKGMPKLNKALEKRIERAMRIYAVK